MSHSKDRTSAHKVRGSNSHSRKKRLTEVSQTKDDSQVDDKRTAESKRYELVMQLWGHNLTGVSHGGRGEYQTCPYAAFST